MGLLAAYLSVLLLSRVTFHLSRVADSNSLMFFQERKLASRVLGFLRQSQGSNSRVAGSPLWTRFLSVRWFCRWPMHLLFKSRASGSTCGPGLPEVTAHRALASASGKVFELATESFFVFFNLHIYLFEDNRSHQTNNI